MISKNKSEYRHNLLVHKNIIEYSQDMNSQYSQEYGENHSDITLPLWHPKSTASRLFIQQLVQDVDKESTKASHHLLSVRGFCRYQLISLKKEQ